MRIQKIIKLLFGFGTYSLNNRVTSTVGVTPEIIARGDANRVSLWISNNSAGWMYVLDDPNVSASNGFYVAPNGGTHIMQFRDDYHIPSLEWWAIAQNADSAITVKEIISK